MQQFVDTVLAVTKESVKTLIYESLHNIVRLINGVSSILLAILPGKSNLLEGLNGWELRPTFRGPRFPRWMENGVSSFNKFIHELSVGSDVPNQDYSSAEEDYDDRPNSSMSQSSKFSRSSTFDKNDGGCRRSTRRNHKSSQLYPIKRFHSNLKDYVIHRATDRRRGVIEDLHLGIEICVEAIFEFCHKTAHFFLSPSEVYKFVCRWFSSQRTEAEDTHNGISDASVFTTTLGESDPYLTERPTSSHSLNTDARTCQDVITELGYPYEAIRVITSDGYVVLLERIPRRDSRKAVYLQHGVFDSSMGWVSNGVVGSPAFAAYDQGFDVYLGNLRGLVSREHVDKNISSRKYWGYSINEHGLEDVPAMIEKIHEVKTSELKIIHPVDFDEINEQQPYKLCAISHSLGGAAMLMYIITRRIEQLPHRLSRLILLSPAGFHRDSNLVFTAIGYLCLLFAPIVAPIMPGVYVPTRFFRMLLNKLARDLYNYPAVGGLVQTLMGYFLGGDSSDWVGVLGLPHYNMNDMPGVSFCVAHHLAQMKRAKRFMMYDYGSAAANMAVYGSCEPLDLGEYYELIDVPVDLVAGRRDNVVRPAMVKEHYRRMKEAGVEATYCEYEYAHLDFTFSHREELLAFVMSRVLLVGSAEKQPLNQKSSRSKRKDE